MAFEEWWDSPEMIVIRGNNPETSEEMARLAFMAGTVFGIKQAMALDPPPETD